MREGLKDDRYNLRMPPPEPLVPRARRLGVRERIRADGRVETPLDRASLDAGIAALRRDNVDSVAVCYFHAWRDPAHERATAAALAAAMPDAYVSLSSQVFPQIKEFDRVSTTIVNAYVGPALSRYLQRLERCASAAAGYPGPLLIIQSHGGVAPVAEAARLAAGGVLSGPAGGVAGSRYAARLLDAGNLIPFDMGGTSTDICLIVDGEPVLVSGRGVGGHRLALNSLDIVSLGAGGGLDRPRRCRRSILHVRSRKAPARIPARPATATAAFFQPCTDANLVLGYLDPAHFLGGRSTLDTAAANAALDRLARDLGTDRIAAAEGVHRVVNTNMAEGIRLVSVRRGVDPRRFALLSFGGAAGLHVTDVARQLDLTRMVVPRVAAVLSAWGMLATDLRFEVSRTHIGDAGRLDGAAVKRLFAEMESEGLSRLRASYDGPVRLRRSVEMRYGEQIFEITVPLDDVDWTPEISAVGKPSNASTSATPRSFLPTPCATRRRCWSTRGAAAHCCAAAASAGAQQADRRAGRAGRRTARLSRWLDRCSRLRFRRAGPRPADHRPRDCRIGDDHGAVTPGNSATVTAHGWLDIAAPLATPHAAK